MSFSKVIQRGHHIANVVCRVRRCDFFASRLGQPCFQVLHRKHAPFHTCSKDLNKDPIIEAIATDDVVTGEGPLMSDLRKRGLYSNFRYGHYHQYTVSGLSISEDRKNIVVDWNDGHTSNFDAIWLRHQCHCDDCKHHSNGMGKINWDQLPLDITVLSVELEDDKLMVFRWGTPEGKELHKGIIPTATLRCYCYSDKQIKERRHKRAMTFHEEKIIPQIECEEMRDSEQGLHKCLTAINDKGLCLVKNVPPNKEANAEIAKLLGPIQNTMYGDQWNVVAVPNPINAAYSESKLALHMDLVFYETAPGLQLLHCIRFDKETQGGSNMFVDIHEIAHKFRREQPDYFDRLSRYPVNFNSIHYNREIPVHMENQKPIFSLNHLGELMSVTWHPMVQGPVELPQKDMMQFYEAYTAFYKMVTLHESLFKFCFEVGDMIIFNNRRILHGREAFSGGGRHLLGCYIELSDYHSRVQALHNKYGEGRFASRSGSHSWF